MTDALILASTQNQNQGNISDDITSLPVSLNPATMYNIYNVSSTTDIEDQESRENNTIPTRAIDNSVASTSQQTIGIIPYAMSGAVGGTVLLVVIILLAVVIVTFLIKRRKQADSHKVQSTENMYGDSIQPLAYNNAVYDQRIGKEFPLPKIGTSIVLFIALIFL
jgi:hypothetical protein